MDTIATDAGHRPCYSDDIDLFDGIALVVAPFTVVGLAVSVGVVWCARHTHQMAVFVKPGLLWPLVLTCTLWCIGQLFSSVHLLWPAVQGNRLGFLMASRVLPGLGEGLTVTLVLYRLYDVAVFHVQHRSATACMAFLMAWPLVSQIGLTVAAFLVPGALVPTGCSDVAFSTSTWLGMGIFAAYVLHVLLVAHFARMSRALWARFTRSNRMYGSLLVVGGTLALAAGLSVILGPEAEVSKFAFTMTVLLTINAMFYGHVGSTLYAVLYGVRYVSLVPGGSIVTITQRSVTSMDDIVLEDSDSDSNASHKNTMVGGASAGGSSASGDIGAGMVEFMNSRSTTNPQARNIRERWHNSMENCKGDTDREFGARLMTSANLSAVSVVLSVSMVHALESPLESEAFLAYVYTFNPYLVELYRDMMALRDETDPRRRERLIRYILKTYLTRSMRTDEFVAEYRDYVRTTPTSGLPIRDVRLGRINRLVRAPAPRVGCMRRVLDVCVRMPLDGPLWPYLPRCARMPRPSVRWPGPSPLADETALETEGINMATRTRLFQEMPSTFVVHGVPVATATNDPENSTDVDLLKHIEKSLRNLADVLSSTMSTPSSDFQRSTYTTRSTAGENDPLKELQTWVYDFLAKVYFGPYVRLYYQDIMYREDAYRSMFRSAVTRGFVAPAHAPAAADMPRVAVHRLPPVHTTRLSGQ